MNQIDISPARRRVMIISIVALNMMALAATDLYLPSIPALPAIFGVSLESVQMTLVAFSAGFALAQVFIGALGDVYSRRVVLSVSVAVFIPATIACAMANSIEALIAARVMQGAAGAASAALTAPLVRDLYDEARAVHAMSVIGGIDAVIPAFAPILGAWVFITYGWEMNFWLLAVIGVPAGIGAFLAMPREKRLVRRADVLGALLGYAALFRSRAFQGYALSHAIVIGGMLGFIFSLPQLHVIHMGEGPDAFIYTQIMWVGSFLAAANVTGILARRMGADRLILLGNIVQIGGGALVLAYALGDPAPQWWPLAIAGMPMCGGFGLRGGAGFAQAMAVMPNHAARASAFILFASMVATGAMTALVAPFIEAGLWSGPAVALGGALLGLVLLRLTPVSPVVQAASSGTP